jgi:hypothetical protein
MARDVDTLFLIGHGEPFPVTVLTRAHRHNDQTCLISTLAGYTARVRADELKTLKEYLG